MLDNAVRHNHFERWRNNFIMVTMLDVAQKAGVSKATVSRVLNGKDIVSEKVRNLVYQAIEETGYRPNLLARQLATQKTHLLGFVMTNALYNGPYFSSLIYHAATFSESHHYQLVLADGKHSAEDERKALNCLLDMKCAGILLYPQYLDEDELQSLVESSPVPIIVINRYLPDHPQHCVTMDHYQSALKLMEYVVGQGHSDIAFIGGKANSYSGQFRYNAFIDTLKNHQLPFHSQLIYQGDWSLDSGYTGAQALLKTGTPFTAIVAANDNMAIGAMKALTEAGYRIPDDISVSGFDNSNISEYVTPTLTTVDFPINQLIENAIQFILETNTKKIKPIEGKLIIRQSVARP